MAFKHFANVPVHDWPHSPDLIQAFSYAKDPRNGREFIWVSQADNVGSSRQTTLFHRHALAGNELRYLDTMRCPSFGHMQTFHVRISALGNPWIWGGIEHAGGTTRAARWQYGKGSVHTSKIKYLNVGAGTTYSCISSPDWKVVVRRSQLLTETYSEHDEKLLLSGVNHPLRTFTRRKVGHPFQGAGASAHSVGVVSGATDKKQLYLQHNWSSREARRLTISNVPSPTGPNTSQEPEGVAVVRGLLMFGKRYNSVDRRVYSLWLPA